MKLAIDLSDDKYALLFERFEHCALEDGYCFTHAELIKFTQAVLELSELVEDTPCTL